MKCQDVRRALPLLVAGEMPLTEWALLERHLVECAECRAELDRQRVQAAQRARIRRRNSTAAALVATAVVLVVAGAGFYIYEASFPDPYRAGTVRVPPRPSASPMTVTPAAPLPAAPAPPRLRSPGPIPVAPRRARPRRRRPGRSTPPFRRRREFRPRPRRPCRARCGSPRAGRPPEPPAEERMPTQARPPAVRGDRGPGRGGHADAGGLAPRPLSRPRPTRASSRLPGLDVLINNAPRGRRFEDALLLLRANAVGPIMVTHPRARWPGRRGRRPGRPDQARPG